MDWTQIIQNVGMFGVGSGILAVLVRSLVSNSLNKDLEAYKSNLQLTTIEHQVRFSRLHGEQTEVIKALYQKLVALDTAIHSVLKRFQQEGEAGLEEKVDEYFRLHNELNELFLPNRIYFDRETCEAIDALLFLSRDTYSGITTYPVDPESPEYKYGPKGLMDERQEFWEKARAVFETDMQKLKERLENQFREMLGVK